MGRRDLAARHRLRCAPGGATTDWSTGRVFLVGGNLGSSTLTTLFERRDGGWAPVATGAGAPPSDRGNFGWDSVRGEAVLHGGYGTGSTLAPSVQTSTWDGTTWAATVRLGAAGLAAGDVVRAVSARWRVGATAPATPGPAAGVSLEAWNGTP